MKRWSKISLQSIFVTSEQFTLLLSFDLSGTVRVGLELAVLLFWGS